MQSIELACEQLMVQTKRGVEGNALKSALEAYKELKDLIGEETDMLERSQLMLKVVGNNLMPEVYEVMTFDEGVIGHLDEEGNWHDVKTSDSS